MDKYKRIGLIMTITWVIVLLGITFYPIVKEYGIGVVILGFGGAAWAVIGAALASGIIGKEN